MWEQCQWRSCWCWAVFASSRPHKHPMRPTPKISKVTALLCLSTTINKQAKEKKSYCPVVFPQNWQTMIPVIRIVTALLSLLGCSQKESIDIRWSQHNGRHKSDCFVGLDWSKSIPVLFVLSPIAIGCNKYWIKKWISWIFKISLSFSQKMSQSGFHFFQHNIKSRFEWNLVKFLDDANKNSRKESNKGQVWVIALTYSFYPRLLFSLSLHSSLCKKDSWQGCLLGRG